MRTAMSSLIDSRAHLEQRLKDIGFNDAAVTLITNSGVVSLNRLAFTIGQPGQPIVNTDVDTFLTNTLGRAPTLAESAGIKQITFEAHTYLVAHLRQHIERKDDTQPRKIAFAERASRMATLKQNLQGLEISGELEPSHNLLDRCCAMYEQNIIKYLEPCTCVSRSLEALGSSKTKEISLERGSLVVKTADDHLTSATDSEIKLHYAFVRRALSFQFAKVMSYSQHNTWERFLFESMHRDAPPGYMRPSLSQVLQCDRAAFARLATLGVSTKQAADGSYPLGVALLELRNDPGISLYLAPLAKPVQQASASTMRPAPYQSGSPNSNKGGKGKSKGKKGNGTPPMPLELRGKFHRLKNGDPICFAYNTQGDVPTKM